MRPPPMTGAAREAHARDPRKAMRYGWGLVAVGTFLIIANGAIVLGTRHVAVAVLVVLLMGVCGTVYGAWFLAFYGPRRRDAR